MFGGSSVPNRSFALGSRAPPSASRYQASRGSIAAWTTWPIPSTTGRRWSLTAVASAVRLPMTATCAWPSSVSTRSLSSQLGELGGTIRARAWGVPQDRSNLRASVSAPMMASRPCQSRLPTKPAIASLGCRPYSPRFHESYPCEGAPRWAFAAPRHAGIMGRPERGWIVDPAKSAGRSGKNRVPPIQR